MAICSVHHICCVTWLHVTYMTDVFSQQLSDFVKPVHGRETGRLCFTVKNQQHSPDTSQRNKQNFYKPPADLSALLLWRLPVFRLGSSMIKHTASGVNGNSNCLQWRQRKWTTRAREIERKDGHTVIKTWNVSYTLESTKSHIKALALTSIDCSDVIVMGMEPPNLRWRHNCTTRMIHQTQTIPYILLCKYPVLICIHIASGPWWYMESLQAPLKC